MSTSESLRDLAVHSLKRPVLPDRRALMNGDALEEPVAVRGIGRRAAETAASVPVPQPRSASPGNL